LDKLQAKARKFQAGQQEDFKRQVDEVRRQRDKAHDLIKGLESSSESAFNEMRKGAEKALDDMNEALKKARSHYQ
jgi:ElaB/YqjD/DUF883 family membrane-anchored ribosome-binding protein